MHFLKLIGGKRLEPSLPCHCGPPATSLDTRKERGKTKETVGERRGKERERKGEGGGGEGGRRRGREKCAFCDQLTVHITKHRLNNYYANCTPKP